MVTEWGKRIGIISNYFPFEINEKQFHHYLANLLICFIVYTNARFNYRSTTNIIKSWKQREKLSRKKMKIDRKKEFAEFEHYKDEFLRILFLFNRQISKILNNQFELTNGLGLVLNQAQFEK